MEGLSLRMAVLSRRYLTGAPMQPTARLYLLSPGSRRCIRHTPIPTSLCSGPPNTFLDTPSVY